MKRIFTLCVALATLIATAGQNKSKSTPEWYKPTPEWSKKSVNSLRADVINYSGNSLSSYTVANLPYNGTVVYALDGEKIKVPIFGGDEYLAAGITFNITETTGVKISCEGNEVLCIL